MQECIRGHLRYKISVGNLKRNTEVIFTIRYINESCVIEGNRSTCLTIPTTLPKSEHVTKRVPQELIMITMDGKEFPYEIVPMEIQLTGLDKGKVKYISSSTHAVTSLTEEPSGGAISMSAVFPGTDVEDIAQDFVVTVHWDDGMKTQEKPVPLHLEGTRGKCSDVGSISNLGGARHLEGTFS